MSGIIIKEVTFPLTIGNMINPLKSVLESISLGVPVIITLDDIIHFKPASERRNF